MYTPAWSLTNLRNAYRIHITMMSIRHTPTNQSHSHLHDVSRYHIASKPIHTHAELSLSIHTLSSLAYTVYFKQTRWTLTLLLLALYRHYCLLTDEFDVHFTPGSENQIVYSCILPIIIILSPRCSCTVNPAACSMLCIIRPDDTLIHSHGLCVQH